MTDLIDGLGRHVTYMRLSVIDRCNLRCTYCMADDVEFLPKPEVLSFEELARLSLLFTGLGIRKIRLTGGEPLARRDISSLIELLGRQVRDGSLAELTLTTNGTLLTRHAHHLARAGVRRINVSLDSLDADNFRRITRRGELEHVLDGIKAAHDQGMNIKINMVVMPNTPMAEIDRLIGWCGQQGHDLTLIETMPLGEFAHAAIAEPSLNNVRHYLEKNWSLIPSDYRSGGPARFVTVQETGRKLGFITPLSHGFCDTCNRLRLTCTGQLVLCLGHESGCDLRTPLRDGASDQELAGIIRTTLLGKAPGHDFLTRMEQGPVLARPIHQLGG